MTIAKSDDNFNYLCLAGECGWAYNSYEDKDPLSVYSYTEVVKALENFNNNKPLKVLLHSYGGHVLGGLKIREILSEYNQTAPVNIYIPYSAYSIATIISLLDNKDDDSLKPPIVGDEINYLIHSSNYEGLVDSPSSAFKLEEELTATNEGLSAFYFSNLNNAEGYSKVLRSRIEKVMMYGDHIILNADQLVKANLAEKIMSSGDIIKEFPIDFIKWNKNE